MNDSVSNVSQPMKVFISQPMNGKSDEIIKEEREEIIRVVKEYYGKIIGETDIEILDTLFAEDAGPIWYLGKAIMMIDKADVVVFANNWSLARGCNFEHDIAVEYGKQVAFYWVMQKQLSEQNLNEIASVLQDSEEKSEIGTCNPSEAE